MGWRRIAHHKLSPAHNKVIRNLLGTQGWCLCAENETGKVVIKHDNDWLELRDQFCREKTSSSVGVGKDQNFETNTKSWKQNPPQHVANGLRHLNRQQARKRPHRRCRVSCQKGRPPASVEQKVSFTGADSRPYRQRQGREHSNVWRRADGAGAESIWGAETRETTVAWMDPSVSALHCFGPAYH